jgi:hypothetical protein
LKLATNILVKPSKTNPEAVAARFARILLIAGLILVASLRCLRLHHLF